MMKIPIPSEWIDKINSKNVITIIGKEFKNNGWYYFAAEGSSIAENVLKNNFYLLGDEYAFQKAWAKEHGFTWQEH